MNNEGIKPGKKFIPPLGYFKKMHIFLPAPAARIAFYDNCHNYKRNYFRILADNSWSRGVKYIQFLHILIRDEHGSILYIMNRNRMDYGERIGLISGEAYRVGSSLSINEKKYIITDLMFLYGSMMQDFQVVIIVKPADPK